MAHPRTQIRKYVAALLAGKTSAGARVTATRVEPHKKSELPAISVYTLHEPIDQEQSKQTAPRLLKRDLELEITAWVAHNDSYPVDLAMDDVAQQIEQAMDGDRWLGGLPNGLAEDTILTGTEMQVVEDDGRSDPLVGIVTLTYSVTYRTSPATAATSDDFTTADVKTTVAGGVSDTPVAEDKFTV